MSEMAQTALKDNTDLPSGKKKNNLWILLIAILVAINIAVAHYFPPIRPEISIKAESLLHSMSGETLTPTPWFTIPLIGPVYLTNTLTAVFVCLLILIAVAVAVHFQTNKNQLKSRGITAFFEFLITSLYSVANNTVEEKWRNKIYPFYISIFIYIMTANLTKLLPFYESFGVVIPAEAEGYAKSTLFPGFWMLNPAKGHHQLISFFRGATTDLNFTLAIAIVAVLMVQIYGIQSKHFAYFEKFFDIKQLGVTIINFFKYLFTGKQLKSMEEKTPQYTAKSFITNFFQGILNLFVSLLELISELAKVVSFSFRLFGNMFAGMVLVMFLGYMVPIALGSFIMLYELFVGILQAFVFCMLTAVFMNIAVQHE